MAVRNRAAIFPDSSPAPAGLAAEFASCEARYIPLRIPAILVERYNSAGDCHPPRNPIFLPAACGGGGHLTLDYKHSDRDCWWNFFPVHIIMKKCEGQKSL